MGIASPEALAGLERAGCSSLEADLIVASSLIGRIVDLNPSSMRMLSSRLAKYGKPVEDLTVGELVRVFAINDPQLDDRWRDLALNGGT